MFRSLASAAPLSTSSASAQLPVAARLGAAALVLTILAAAALLIDLPVAEFVKLGKVPGDVARLVRLSEAFAYGGTAGLIILLAVVLDPRGWRIAPRLAISAFGAGLLADALKLLVSRQRPSATDLADGVVQTFVGWLPLFQDNHRLQSFPSAHTATAIGLAIALSALYPRGWWLFATFALLAGFQRIESQSHFLSDVLVGAAVGCLVGAACADRGLVATWLARIEAPKTSTSDEPVLSAGPTA